MKKEKYVIQGTYYFGLDYSGPRPKSKKFKGVSISLTHDEAMELGKYLKFENPYYMEPYDEFGMFDLVNEKITNFNEDLSDMDIEWDEKLKSDLIKYYEEHCDEGD